MSSNSKLSDSRAVLRVLHCGTSKNLRTIQTAQSGMSVTGAGSSARYPHQAAAKFRTVLRAA
jgi:hypothetical protein